MLNNINLDFLKDNGCKTKICKINLEKYSDNVEFSQLEMTILKEIPCVIFAIEHWLNRSFGIDVKHDESTIKGDDENFRHVICEYTLNFGVTTVKSKVVILTAQKFCSIFYPSPSTSIDEIINNVRFGPEDEILNNCNHKYKNITYEVLNNKYSKVNFFENLRNDILSIYDLMPEERKKIGELSSDEILKYYHKYSMDFIRKILEDLKA